MSKAADANSTSASTLDAFLAELDDEAAAGARVAAVRMDELERSVDHLRDLESRYWWVAAISLLLFLVGTTLVLFPGEYTRPIYLALGPLITTLMIASLGLVGMIYAYIVRDRSQVDDQKMSLNREHFVPFNAYYFPPETPSEDGRVIRYTPRKLKPQLAGPHDFVQPGRSWW